ncbi:MAG TPA: acyl-CoA carboxylase subunit beta [Gammaproteobacteria bacterium]|jgi:acetyl-CoA carboxylase carboxyltransferase component|nr:acyl-CoA carboxylase subunit beta [Gammaproteobacteria bacterium]HIB75307.1 acyl-CoA carboxylase subunit beta [Gammaproteobacteria bacterium]HIN73892.1 acyl-CoA carboxylase subunit beta [Gammaproteobacteria bacterium]
MSNPLLAPQIKSKLDTSSETFSENKSVMMEKLEKIEELLDYVELGGGMHHHERLAARGKMAVRDRISNFLDPDTPFLEISALAAYDSAYPIGGGAVAGIGIVAGTEVVVFANDPTVLAGAMHAYSSKKWTRAMEIARDNRLPYVQFVESAGGDLRMGGKGRRGNSAPPTGGGHFAESGRTFYEITELSKLRIPTISIVFGSSTAGGAYQPGMSDYNIFIKKQSKVFLGGPPLVKMATGEESDDETLGGAQMHAETSGLADYLAEDEMDAIRIGREVVSHLNWRKRGNKPSLKPEEPINDPEDLLGLVDPDLKKPFDIREVVTRITDGSRFEEFKPLFGPNIVCGFASIHGYQIGILGNNGGIIYPDSAQKGAHFVQLCNQIDIPILFLQNVTGFIVGKDYERAGQIKKGAQFLNSVSNSNVPHITVIVGASIGAGTYAMSGRAYNNRFTFLWPTAKVAVMGPKQIAGVMSIVRRRQAARKGEKFNEKEDAEIVAMAEAMQEEGSLALRATGAISDDGIIDPRDTRSVLGMCLSVVNGKEVEGAAGYGVYRL